MATLGNTNSGATLFSCTPDYKRGYRVAVPADLTIFQFGAWCSCDADGGDQWRGMVYADNAGSPGALIGQSDALAVSAGAAKAKRYAACSTPIFIDSGTHSYVWIWTQAETGKLNMYYDLDASIDAGQAADTWSDGPEDPCGSYTANTRKYAFAADYTLGANQAPNAPTITSPATGTAVVVGVDNRISFTFSDPDTGDYQTKVKLRWSVSGAGSWTTIESVTSEPYIDIPSGTLTAGVSYDVQLATADKLGVYGAWTSSLVLDGVNVPSAPAITDPTDDESITSAAFAVTYTATNQVNAQVRRVADNAGSPNTSIVYETVAVAGSVLRTGTVTFDTDGRTEHVQARIEYPAGIWSDWDSVRVTTDLPGPIVPLGIPTADATNGRITITITNPPDSPTLPAATSNDIYRSEAGAAYIRIATGLAVNATYQDYLVRSGVAYTYKVRAYAATGAYAEWTGGTAYALVDGNADGMADGLFATLPATSTPSIAAGVQRIQATGGGGDAAQWFILSDYLPGYAAGEAVTFLMAMDAWAAAGCETHMGIWAYDSGNNYLGEVTAQITEAGDYAVTYSALPANTASVRIGLTVTLWSAGNTLDISFSGFYAG